jgi:hypothetical protein
VDHLASNGPMVVLNFLDLAAGLVLAAHTAFEARLAMPAETGENLDTIQSRHQAALHSSLVKDFAALEPAVRLYQHGLKRL